MDIGAVIDDNENRASPAISPADDISILAGGASISLAGKIVGRGLGLIGDIAAARILGPVAFGLYAIGWTLLRILSLLTPLGLDKGVQYFGVAVWKKDSSACTRLVRQSLGLALLSGLISGVALFFCAPWLSESVFHKPELTYIFRWFSLSFPTATCLTVILAATRITLKMSYSVWIQDLLQPFVGLLFLLLFYLIGLRLPGVLASDVISFAAALIVALYFLRRIFPTSSGPASTINLSNKNLLTFSIPAALAGVFTPFLVWVDRLFVGFFRSSSETGVYQAASQTSVIFAIIMVGFAAIVTPMFARFIQKKDTQRLEELFQVSTKWGLYVSLPIFLWIFIFPQQVLTAVFDQRYAEGWVPLVILSIGELINVGTGAVAPLLIMSGRQKRWSVLSGSALIVNIILNWILVPRWGMVGAALGTAFTLSSLFLIGVLQIRKYVGVWPYDRRYIKGIVAAFFTGLVFLAIRLICPVVNLPILLLSLIMGIGVFILILLGLGLDPEDRSLLRMISFRQIPSQGKDLTGTG
jgi:O-antigen/teichoic acid export membrane protein